MRRMTMAAAAGAVVLCSALAAVGTASAEPDVTLEQCVRGGGGPLISLDENAKITAECSGGRYDGHRLILRRS
ncbi:hypothetical protein ACRAKI_21250 [Saccharothrix isguenensis]